MELQKFYSGWVDSSVSNGPSLFRWLGVSNFVVMCLAFVCFLSELLVVVYLTNVVALSLAS